VTAITERFFRYSQSCLRETYNPILQGKLAALPGSVGSAQLALTFEASNKPQRVDWLEGDASLRSVGDRLREKEFPVKFPDVSSVKIILRAVLTCDASACTVVLQPVEER
jgi:hypothetical protein